MKSKGVSVQEAKTQFSKLLARVEQGEEIVIARAGHPVARLSPFDPKSRTLVLGSACGEVWIAEDFDAPLPDDLLKEFEK